MWTSMARGAGWPARRPPVPSCQEWVRESEQAQARQHRLVGHRVDLLLHLAQQTWVGEDPERVAEDALEHEVADLVGVHAGGEGAHQLLADLVALGGAPRRLTAPGPAALDAV